ncbi:bifunctional cytochrome P450/NADPH--P450 reductase [Variovorax sp. PAMC 28711]|uniref:bifunctional cytochrome P450/NADPH--P450 reductase n=1 Tax=Variovorax sp. PAMC 28711 TaxID=1795631 RepID=UPI00078C4E17|nr:cytochrome P450 [Variovorax sp. PAMC 28711]AMM24364.1 NADPH--cytochrome reductase [Variovorax sp. PAMC 28711]
MAGNNALYPIPHPSKKPFVGNLLSIDSESPVMDMWRIAQELGGIYWLDMPGMPVIVVSSPALVDELCEEARFDKSTRGALRRLRAASHGLFTSDTHEPTWSKPHNILLANFSQRAMQAYHPMMLDIAEQLVTKWERLNFDDEVDVTRDMTALTLDTIGLCGFGYRFNSFYREGFHPFVDAMVRTLETVQDRRGLPLEEFMMKKQLTQQRKDIRYMHTMVEDIIKERRESGADIASKPDLLSYMIAGVDKKSGEKLDDKMIRDECIEFLIAGHETTSGLLSFATYFLLKNPDVMARAQAEVDSVFGTDLSVRPTYAQVNRLQYVLQILKEALRLYPTAPAISMRAKENTTIGGKYTIHKKNMVIMHALALHRDKGIWGENADQFNPDNFTREAERTRPANAFKPFGNGQRACIGRQFALQEAVLTLGMVIQRFKLIDHTDYKLKVKEALTIKPEGFRIKVVPREAAALRARPSTAIADTAASQVAGALAVPLAASRASRHGTSLLVLHGSNLGSAEDLARQLAEAGEMRGFSVTLASLDDYAERLPAAGAVAIVSASYNGTAPDNAVEFWRWLERADGSLNGVAFSVFGCGNTDWASTYQSVPRRIDERLAELGAERVHARGEGDAREDMDGAFQDWADALWPVLSKRFDLEAEAPIQAEPLYAVEALPPPQTSGLVESLGAVPMRVVANDELQTTGGETPSGRSTRHVELALPEGVNYRAGDHLSVVPRNGAAQVERAMARFGFERDAHVRLHAAQGRKAFLPVDEVIAVERLLGDYVELQDVATRKQIATMATHTRCPVTQKAFAALTGSDEATAAHYKREVLVPRKSVLDLMEEFPVCELPFAAYLEMLSPLSPRYYSISSSPRVDAGRCSVTVGVVREAARSGRGTFEGVCSNFLARVEPGDTVHGFVRATTAEGFGLPDDPSKPIIMVGPGTGLAPFRGFLQDRAAQKTAGATLGDAMLFFGCRHPQQDFIYAGQLQAWAKEGLVDLHTAFSRAGGRKAYVQDLIREQADAVWKLLEAGATVYVCGDGSRMEPDVRRTLADIAREHGEDSDAWMDKMLSTQRYVLDVWAAS